MYYIDWYGYIDSNSTVRYQKVPENDETIAATMKDNTTAGPAIDLATVPANTYTPHPNVAPMPRAVKSKIFNTRFNFSFPGSTSSVNVFFLHSD
jgi:hypothetical protein